MFTSGASVSSQRQRAGKVRICMDYDYRLYSLYLLSDLSLTVDYIPQEHPPEPTPAHRLGGMCVV